MKQIQRAWALSLLVICLTTLVIAASWLLPAAVPDWAVRLAGVLDLAALFALAYTTFKKLQKV